MNFWNLDIYFQYLKRVLPAIQILSQILTQLPQVNSVLTIQSFWKYWSNSWITPVIKKFGTKILGLNVSFFLFIVQSQYYTHRESISFLALSLSVFLIFHKEWRKQNLSSFPFICWELLKYLFTHLNFYFQWQSKNHKINY